MEGSIILDTARGRLCNYSGNVTAGIIYGTFQLEIMTVLTDAGCYMGPTLLVTACTTVARNARHAVLAGTLSCHLIAGLARRPYRMTIAR